MESFLLAAQGSPPLPHLPRCSAQTPTARRWSPQSNSSRQQSSSSLSSSSLCRTPRAPEDDRRLRQRSRHTARTSVADRPQVTAADGRFLKWLEGQAAPIEKVSIRSQHRAGEDIDMTVRHDHRKQDAPGHQDAASYGGNSGRTNNSCAHADRLLSRQVIRMCRSCSGHDCR